MNELFGDSQVSEVYCGFCRRGHHARCRALRFGASKAMAGIEPQGEENCACSCDPTQPIVAGTRAAREWAE